jgi:membrane-bound lytic murein transglycosylase B
MIPARSLLLAASMPLLAIPAVASADDGAAGFELCIASLQQQAREQELSGRIVDVLGGLEFQSRVIELDRAQPEFTRTFSAYLRERVTGWKVARGRMLLARHRDLLDRLTAEYGVPGRYLVAFWGMETNYGSFLGSMPTLDVLATLACDERRSELFTDELFHALRLVQRDALEPDEMKGSWAGAMGHMQFMPSSYAGFARDGDGDGEIDLWNSPADAFASAAAFLAGLGWRRGERWGREVRLPEGFPYGRSGLRSRAAVSDWAELGVRRADGRPLPAADLSGAVLVPMGHRGPKFLVYPNFEVILDWNRSQSYALAVGHLADRIAGGGPLAAELPEVETPLSRAHIERLQRRLAQLGFDPGPVDGLVGPGTRAALRSWQSSVGRIADGYPDPSTLAALAETEADSER